ERDHVLLVVRILVRPADPVLRIADLVGMRNARGVFGDVAVIGERRNRFSVPEARRTQNQPRGPEDGDTAFSESLPGDMLQAGNRRPLASKIASKSTQKWEEGDPPSRPPLLEPKGPRRFGQNAGGPVMVSPGLLGRSLRHRNDRDEGAVFGFRTVLHAS